MTAGGATTAVVRIDPARAFADILERVREAPTGCWVWTGAASRGYGIIRRRGYNYQVHRIAYLASNGPLLGDLCVDHTCHDPAVCPGGHCEHRLCVNPEHLRLLTRAENAARSSQAFKPFCVNGHERTPENLRPNRQGRKVCVPCTQIWRQRASAAA